VTVWGVGAQDNPGRLAFRCFGGNALNTCQTPSRTTPPTTADASSTSPATVAPSAEPSAHVRATAAPAPTTTSSHYSLRGDLLACHEVTRCSSNQATNFQTNNPQTLFAAKGREGPGQGQDACRCHPEVR
jgi:hypothetical protein